MSYNLSKEKKVKDLMLVSVTLLLMCENVYDNYLFYRHVNYGLACDISSIFVLTLVCFQ